MDSKTDVDRSPVDADCSGAGAWCQGPNQLSWTMNAFKFADEIMHIAEMSFGTYYVCEKAGAVFWHYGPEAKHKCETVKAGQEQCEIDFQRKMSALFAPF